MDVPDDILREAEAVWALDSGGGATLHKGTGQAAEKWAGPPDKVTLLKAARELVASQGSDTREGVPELCVILHALSEHLPDPSVTEMFVEVLKTEEMWGSAHPVARHYLARNSDGKGPVTQRMLSSASTELTPPKFVEGTSIHLEVLAGSHAFGTATEDSDRDVIGVCVPPPEVVFPVLAGEIPGFGRQKQRFRVYDADGIQFEGTEWDLKVFNIVEFFDTCMDANPTWLEALFVPSDKVLHSTPVGEHIRRNSDVFLHKGAFHRFTGYARSMISKMTKRDRTERRLCKYGYHAVRLVDELEEILSEGTLTLGLHAERHREVRNGEWDFDEIEEYVASKEETLRDLYDSSTKVPYSPDETRIREVLIDCLKMAFRRPPASIFKALADA